MLILNEPVDAIVIVTFCPAWGACGVKVAELAQAMQSPHPALNTEGQVRHSAATFYSGGLERQAKLKGSGPVFGRYYVKSRGA